MTMIWNPVGLHSLSNDCVVAPEVVASGEIMQVSTTCTRDRLELHAITIGL